MANPLCARADKQVAALEYQLVHKRLLHSNASGVPACTPTLFKELLHGFAIYRLDCAPFMFLNLTSCTKVVITGKHGALPQGMLHFMP